MGRMKQHRGVLVLLLAIGGTTAFHFLAPRILKVEEEPIPSFEVEPSQELLADNAFPATAPSPALDAKGRKRYLEQKGYGPTYKRLGKVMSGSDLEDVLRAWVSIRVEGDPEGDPMDSDFLNGLRDELAKSPETSAQSIGEALRKMPQDWVDERNTLHGVLYDLIYLGASLETFSTVSTQEFTRPYSPKKKTGEGEGRVAPPVHALKRYLEVQDDAALRTAAWQSALDSQKHPEVREQILLMKP